MPVKSRSALHSEVGEGSLLTPLHSDLSPWFLKGF